MTTKKKTNKPNYQELLILALNEPGVISKAYRAMPEYSFGNQMIATQQMVNRGIEISPLKSFNGWKASGLYVNKGQKAIALWLPITKKNKDPSEKDEVFFIMRANWFALSQTSGWNKGISYLKPIPKFNKDLALKELGIELGAYNSLNGRSMGYSEVSTGVIAVSPLSPHPEKTFFHEVAHQVLHTDEKGEKMSRALKEVEAESVAFILTNFFEVLEEDVSSSSRAYIQGWLKKEGLDQVPKENASRIFSAVTRIRNAGRVKED